MSSAELQRQYELALRPSGDGDLDVSFLHSSFCLSGLPLRALARRSKQSPTGSTLPADALPRKEIQTFHRRGTACSLTINTPTLPLSENGELTIGVPYGSRARILMLWITTEAQRQRDTGNRWMEFGSIRSWINQMGISYCSETINALKDQLIRLSFANFTMTLNQNSMMYFKNDILFESGVFHEQDLEYYAADDLPNVRMPIGLELSQKAFERFTRDNAIPIPTQSLHGIANNSMAIDLFVYFCYKLRQIPPGEMSMVTWKNIIGQFGNGEPKSLFLQSFRGSIDKAIGALTCARIDVDDEGLRLHHAPPADFRRMFVVNPQPRKQAKVRTANRILPAPAGDQMEMS